VLTGYSGTVQRTPRPHMAWCHKTAQLAISPTPPIRLSTSQHILHSLHAIVQRPVVARYRRRGTQCRRPPPLITSAGAELDRRARKLRNVTSCLSRLPSAGWLSANTSGLCDSCIAKGEAAFCRMGGGETRSSSLHGRSVPWIISMTAFTSMLPTACPFTASSTLPTLTHYNAAMEAGSTLDTTT
jgi:hypothetical protein